MVARLRVPVYARYVMASAFALGLDSATFLMLIGAGVPPVAAAGLGYSLGIAAHWLISSRAVFADRVRATDTGRRAQMALFVLTALVGLALTMAIVGTGHALGLDPRIAKLIAIGVAFQTTWLLRRHIVFG